MAVQRTSTRTVSGVSSSSIASIRKLFKEAKALFAPEGEFMGGIEAQLARTEKRAVASGMQGLVAAGLGGTSMMGGLGKKFQEEVAVPALARAESTRLSSLANIYTQQAGAEVSLAPRTTTQFGYGSQETSQWGIPRRPQPATQARPAQRTAIPGATRQVAPTTKPTAPAPPPTNVGPSLPDPAGTRQATIGGISYFSDGKGGFTTQGQSTTRRQPAKLTSFYDFNKPASPTNYRSLFNPYTS